MQHRRAVLFAILIYVTLDLSLPMMPGAFVFDPDGSVESIQMNRGRAGHAEVLVLPARPGESAELSPPRIHVTRGTAPLGERRRVVRHPGLSTLPRAAVDPAASAEDPH